MSLRFLAVLIVPALSIPAEAQQSELREHEILSE